MLGWVKRYDPVDARLHLVAAREAQRVADVDNSTAVLGPDEPKLARTWRANLEAPLLCEEQSQRADVGVLLMPDLLGGGIRRDIVHHCERGRGRAIVSVSVLETCRTRESESRG